MNDVAHLPTAAPAAVTVKPKRLNLFERYLSIWVALCMVVGVIVGLAVPGLTDGLRRLEFGSVRNVGPPPRGLFVTLFVNWLVKPFSMAFIAWLFFRYIFSAWISPADADQYIAGSIILAAAPCTAMVFVWSYLTDGDPAYTLVQVSVNDLLMLLFFAPIVTLLVAGASNLVVPFGILFTSVVVFIVIPLAAGVVTRSTLIKSHGVAWFNDVF